MSSGARAIPGPAAYTRLRQTDDFEKGMNTGSSTPSHSHGGAGGHDHHTGMEHSYSSPFLAHSASTRNLEVPSMPGRPVGLRTKKGRMMRWLILDSDGSKRIQMLDKRQVIQVLNLDVPIRDMRLMDSALGSPDIMAQLLVRDNALVFAMEHLRMIITADQVIVPLEDDKKEEWKDRCMQSLEVCIAERHQQIQSELRGFQAEGGSPTTHGSSVKMDYEALPFELHVLEFGLGEICNHLVREVHHLQAQTGPALEDLIKNADRENLERVRKIKTSHQRYLGRVKAVRDSVQRLVEDDDSMCRMCLTHVREATAAATAAAAIAAAAPINITPPASARNSVMFNSSTDQPGSFHGFGNSQVHRPATLGPFSTSPPQSPMTSAASGDAAPSLSIGVGSLSMGSMGTPLGGRTSSLLSGSYTTRGMGMMGSSTYRRGSSMLRMQERLQQQHDAAAAGSGLGMPQGSLLGNDLGQSGTLQGQLQETLEDHMQDVENLLESYFMMADNTLHKVIAVGEYIDDTEDLINIQLDHSRNNLIRFEILLTTATFALAFCGVVAGMLGENLVLPPQITGSVMSFMLVNCFTFALAFAGFVLIFVFLRNKKLI